MKLDKGLPRLSSLNLLFFDIFLATFNTITVKKIICICDKIKVKYLHELTETLASLYFSHVIPQEYYY